MSTYYFTGTARYPQVYAPVDCYDKAKGKEWTISLKPDEESLALLQESGCQLRPSKDGEGYYTFRRPTQKVIKDKIETYKAPVVLSSDLSPFSEKIGNGSTVTLKVSIYKTQKGVGHTLEAVRVDEHVPYDGNTEHVPNDDLVPF